MKKLAIVVFACLLLTSFAMAAPHKKVSSGALFQMGGLYVTPQVGLNSWTIPFGANVEYALTENVGIGGTVMFWFWSDEGWSTTIIAPAGEVTYHFTQLELDKIDLSAGGGLGYAIYSSTGGSGTGSIYPYILLNGRYFFNPKMALNLRINVGFGTWGSAGGTVGLTFVL